MKTVIISESAESDLFEASAFYELQELGVGDYLFESLLVDIEKLSVLHGVHSLRCGYFKMLATKFPHGIYYEDLTDSVRVVAVLDLRRNPEWIRQQLGTRKKS